MVEGVWSDGDEVRGYLARLAGPPRRHRDLPRQRRRDGDPEGGGARPGQGGLRRLARRPAVPGGRHRRRAGGERAAVLAAPGAAAQRVAGLRGAVAHLERVAGVPIGGVGVLGIGLGGLDAWAAAQAPLARARSCSTAPTPGPSRTRTASGRRCRRTTAPATAARRRTCRRWSSGCGRRAASTPCGCTRGRGGSSGASRGPPGGLERDAGLVRDASGAGRAARRRGRGRAAPAAPRPRPN